MPANNRLFRIATRHSPLAMWQAEYVAAELHRIGIRTTLVPLVSSGDIDMRPMDIAMPGEQRTIGVFTKRIQQALIDDEADVAVHSLKDLPTAVDERFCLAAVPPRADVRDSLVSPQKYDLQTLPPGAIVGTGSKRRAAQLRRQRPDLTIEPIRGNVQTRLAKLSHGEFAAIVLAEAGLQRLQMNDLSRTKLSVTDMLPAPGQAALAIEVRSDDAESAAAVAKLDDAATHLAVHAERSMLSMLDGGCLAPIAALATLVDDVSLPTTMSLKGIVLSTSGQIELECTQRARVETLADAAALGRQVAEELSQEGAADLLRRDAATKNESDAG